MGIIAIRQRGTLAVLSVVLALAGCHDSRSAPDAEPSATASGSAADLAPAPVVPAASAAPSDAPSAVPQDDESDTPARTATHYRPQDECAGLPGFAAFRGRLADAVGKRDAAALGLLAAPDVTLDYGGGHGRDELIRRLSGESGTALWNDLGKLLTLGCDTRDGLVVLPWYFWNVPESLDPGTTMLTTGPVVPLLAKPSPKAETLTTLDWEMVTLLPGFDPAQRFTHVQVGDDLRGYIETRDLRSVLARRLIAETREGQWQVTALVAGD